MVLLTNCLKLSQKLEEGTGVEQALPVKVIKSPDGNVLETRKNLEQVSDVAAGSHSWFTLVFSCSSASGEG